jgi:hypothetical protein
MSMRQPQRKGEVPLYQKLVLPWEEKLRSNRYLIWDGSYRWFCSDNIIPLERYRDSAAIQRIKTNIMNKIPRY